MSSRRKGKPQQRILDGLMTKDEQVQTHHVNTGLTNGIDASPLLLPTHAQIDLLCKILLEKMEPEQDLLTCGNCQREFLLSEITKFIQHKVSRCNKENVEPFDEDGGGDFDAKDESMSTIINNRRTSISAPIANKAASDTREKQSPRLSHVERARSSSPENLPESEKPKDGSTTEGATKKTEQATSVPGVDKACNTSYSEPGLLTCRSCKSLFTSAWSLLQHAQRAHGIRIFYSERDVSEDKPEVKKENDLHTPPPSLQPVPRSPSHQYISMDKTRDLDLTRNSSRSSGASVHSAASLVKIHPTKSPINRSPSSSGSDIYNQSPPFQVPRQPLSPVVAFGPGGPFSRPPFSPEINNDIMAGPFRRISPYNAMPSGLDHVSGFSFPPFGIEGSTSLADFYSKRLQQLAKPNSFLAGNHIPGFLSHPPFGHGPPLHPGATSHMVAEASKHHPNKTKNCEFCHKQFKSATYLVIHRRSHTGEKPFKCPICSYACSHATKLKKHLHIHSQLKSLLALQNRSSGMLMGGENNRRSNSSTPDSKTSIHDLDADLNEEDLSEEVCLQRETLAEGFIIQIAEEWRKKLRNEQDNDGEDEDDENEDDEDDEDEDLSRNSLINHRKRLADGGEKAAKDGDNPKDLSLSKEQRVAILSEVMNDTGLGGIAEYKEAYSIALKESGNCSTNNDISKSEASKENLSDNGLTDAHHRSSVGSMSSTHSKSSSRTLSHADRESPVSKKVKLEPEDHTSSQSSHAFPSAELYQSSRDMFHRGMSWHLGRRDLLNIVMPGAEQHLLSSPHQHENGLHDGQSPKPMRFSTAHAGISPTTPTGSIQGVPQLNMRRRNDTCEFCGKIFKNCSNLTVHRRSHTGEKPYKCELCNYACAQSSKLTRHMRTHGRVGMDVFRCKFCNMPFSVASTLEKHMRRCVEKHQREAAGLPPLDSPTESLDSSSASNA